MVDGPGRSGDDERDIESVMNRLDEIAEAEGLSREEAVENLISSYWRLEEIVDLIGASEDRPDQPSVQDHSREIPHAADVEGLHNRVDKLIEGLRQQDDQPTDRSDLLRSIKELENRLDQLDELDTKPAKSVPEPGEPEPNPGSELETRIDSIEESLSRLDDRIDELAAESASEDQLQTLTTQTQSFQDRILRQHESLHDTVHSEFENIRDIVEYLLEKTEANEARAERVDEKIDRRLLETLAMQDTLGPILQSANRLGVKHAQCEHCETTVDLSMLQTPDCPTCEQRFSDVETSQRFFGLSTSNILTVEDTAHQPPDNR